MKPSAAAPHPSRRRGVSLVELLLALAITAMLLTATMVALDASFRAYADAAEQAAVQTTSRMVTHRLLSLVRTSTAHGPLEPDAASDPPVTLAGDLIQSHYLELLDPRGDIIRIEYRSDPRQLWLIRNPGAAGEVAQPVADGVLAAAFTARRRRNDDNLWVLERATVDLTIEASEDNTLAVENGQTPPIRIIGSTMPRKLD